MKTHFYPTRLLLLLLTIVQPINFLAANELKHTDEAIVDGASQRIRPMLMTSLASFMGLLPILWSTGAGADVMKRIAAPMVGGIASSLFIVLLVFPAVYSYCKEWK